MADLSDKDAAQTVKLVGTNPTTGLETNYIDATLNGIKVDGSAVTQPVISYPTTTASYSAASVFSVAANPTDIFTLTGSATKVVKIYRVSIVATKTSSGTVDTYMIKRSTANTGGTANTLTAVSNDSTNASATAVARSYTANPTVGTSVGNLAAHKLYLSTANNQPIILEENFDIIQPFVLRGTNEVFAINLNGITQAGNSFAIYIQWTEE